MKSIVEGAFVKQWKARQARLFQILSRIFFSPLFIQFVSETPAHCAISTQIDTGKFGKGEVTWDYWTPGNLMLADPGHFLYTMENYDKENLTEEMINKLKVYIENPNFQPPKVSLYYIILYKFYMNTHKKHTRNISRIILTADS